MAKLALRHCTPLKKGTKPISDSIAISLSSQLNSAWHLKGDSLVRTFEFKDFYQTIAFVNSVAWIANQQDHHPDLEVSYKKCIARYTSHAARGLTVNDFICAAKIDTLIVSKSEPGNSVKPKKTSAKPSPKKADRQETPQPSLAFNVEEAEDLLAQELAAKPPAPTHIEEDEDEFILDPIEETTQKNDEAAKLAQKQLAGKSQTPTKASTEPEATTKLEATNPNTKTEDNVDLMATMILPPGMISVRPNTDADEDATLVMHAIKIDGDDDRFADTLITPPGKEPQVAETQIIEPPEPSSSTQSQQDPDEVRTVILATTDDIAKPPAQATAKPETQAAGNANTPSTPKNEPASRHAIKERSVEETMVLSSHPTGNHKANTPPPTPEATQKPDPGIEDDETLVMHVNTYKSVNKKE